jgi:hypothetical protein
MPQTAFFMRCCALPLVSAFFVLSGAHKADADDAALNELLVQELVADVPLLLSQPPLTALEKHSAQAEAASRGPGAI